MNEDFIENTKILDLDNELELEITSFIWGNRCNLIINCIDTLSKCNFWFSVFNNNGYSSKSGDFNFKVLKEKNEKKEQKDKIKIIAKLRRAKSGYLSCVNARLI